MIKSFIEYIRLLKYLSISRVFNAAKIYSSYQLSRLTSSPIHWGMPFSISIEPTTSCNLRCPECVSGLRDFKRPTGMMSKETFNKVLDEASSHLIYLNFYFQGEPFLNQDIYPMIRSASDRSIYTSTSTNAHYLSRVNCRKIIESGLTRLIVSIDGTTQESYQKYRIGGDLNKVIDGLKMLVEEKKKASSPIRIVIQFLVFRQNEHERDEIKRLAKEIGVEVWIKSAQIYDFEKGSELMPQDENLSRYKKDSSGKYIIKNELLNRCWKLWHSTVFTWDGDSVPCCFDKNATHKFGNIHAETLNSIWRGARYTAFRKSMITSRGSIDICRNCSEGTKVFE